jgi:hypothetical protein
VEAGAKATGTPHLYPKGTKNAHTKDAKRSLLHRAIDDNIRSAVAMVGKLDDLRDKITQAKNAGDSAKLAKLKEQFKVLYKQQGELMKKQKAYDDSRRSRLHAALDYAMNYGTPPKIRKTLSILNPNDLAKMTGGMSSSIGKGKPYTGFAKDAGGPGSGRHSSGYSSVLNKHGFKSVIKNVFSRKAKGVNGGVFEYIELKDKGNWEHSTPGVYANDKGKSAESLDKHLSKR